MAESLGINWTAVIWHTFNFLLLMVLLWRFLYRPVLNMLDQRRARIEGAHFVNAGEVHHAVVNDRIGAQAVRLRNVMDPLGCERARVLHGDLL